MWSSSCQSCRLSIKLQLLVPLQYPAPRAACPPCVAAAGPARLGPGCCFAAFDAAKLLTEDALGARLRARSDLRVAAPCRRLLAAG